MLNFLKTHIIGGTDDQVNAYVWHWWFTRYEQLGYTNKYFNNLWGAPFGYKIPNLNQTNQPLFRIIFGGLIQYVNPVLFVNIFSLLMPVLTFLTGYFFFKLFRFRDFICLILSLTVALSPYTYIHMAGHPALSQVWILIIFLICFIHLNRKLKFTTAIYCGLLLAAIVLLNNYLGYFAILFIGSYLLARVIFARPFKIQLNGWQIITKYSSMIIVFLVIAIPLLWPYIETNYSSQQTYNSQNNTEMNATKPIEDFFYFTSRPWYYFLPHPDNPFLGKITTKAIDILQNGWGYWLTTNYFPNEHSASYIGWVNTILLIVGIIGIKKNKHIKAKLEIKLLSVTSLFLVLLTLPPYFTISLHKVYTPTYFLWIIFPMFRTLSRLGILVLILLMPLIGVGYNTLFNILRKKYNKFIAYFSLLVLTTFTLFEFYIPVSIDDYSITPAEFTFIKENTQSDSIIAVYPYGRSVDTFYWIKEYERGLINPRDYVNSENNFNALTFTDALISCEGLSQAQSYGVTHILLYTDNIISEDVVFFSTTKFLHPIYDINGVIIYEVSKSQKIKC